MKKKFLVFPYVVIAIILLFSIVYLSDKHHYQKMSVLEDQVEKWTADTEPLIELDKVQAQLKKINYSLKGEVDYNKAQFITIPGLRGAWSIDPETGQAAYGNNWVPQGLTESKDQYFVSAYDGSHKLNSLIFIIDKKYGKYIKTLIFHSKAHVGGIGYDFRFDRLWVSDDTKAMGRLSYISLIDIENYQASETQKPINSTTVKLPWDSRTSAIALYNEQIVIAKYGKNKEEHFIAVVPLDSRTGLPERLTNRMEKEVEDSYSKEDLVDVLLNEQVITSITSGWNRMQGVTINQTNGMTLFSQSNGESYSRIRIEIPNEDVGSNFNFSMPKKGVTEFKAPHSVEEISLNHTGDRFSIIFESGAKKYRERGNFLYRPTILDRIIILPVEPSN